MKHVFTAQKEFFLIAVICLATFAFAQSHGVLEIIADWASRYEHFEIDEMITTLIVLAICLEVFAFRRWRESADAQKKLQHKNMELQSALAEIKELRGIIPICSYCKKIRDDKGYWNKLEHYLHTHSRAKMSHSICPDCLHKHYPALSENQ